MENYKIYTFRLEFETCKTDVDNFFEKLNEQTVSFALCIECF